MSQKDKITSKSIKLSGPKSADLTVSIVIPAYNEEDNIAACLESIKNQTVQPDEVVVVDNNSTDKTAEIASSYSFVKLIRETKQGILPARTAGFNAAKSKIIGRIDADTKLWPGWVESVRRYYSSPEHAENSVSGRGYYYNLPWPKTAGRVMHAVAFDYNKLLLGGYILWGSNMAMPKKLWQEIESELCQRTDIHEDIDIAIHLQSRGKKVEYRKSMLVGVKMKRLKNINNGLLQNLMLWPRTLKVHGMISWPLAGFVAVILFMVYIPLYVAAVITTIIWPNKKFSV